MKIEHVAVLGSGTMGAGIAQAALGGGYPVRLYDVDGAALERARERITAGLSKQGRLNGAPELALVTSLDDLSGVSLAIEAVPERLELKREVFAALAERCPAPAILASNTSSLPIGAIAAACPAPERVAGLHFFNPVHRMALVEVVRAAATDDETIDALLAFVRRIGKTPVLARDTPGFVVNRVARPFYGEALRLLGERVAPPETIDAALRQAGGFPLGPFALMDLIGIDVNYAVTVSMYEQSFGEPRYRPHLIQQQMVQQGRLGRKTGRGFYRYDGAPDAAPAEPAGAATGAAQASLIVGSGTWAPGLDERCRAAGMRLLDELPYGPSDVSAGFVVAGRGEGAIEQALILDRQLPEEALLFVQCGDITAAEIAGALRRPERLVGFDGLFTEGAVTLAATPLLADAARSAAGALVRALGLAPLWAEDSPALIVPRVAAMLANEAAFALGEGVAEAGTIDTAMRLGAGHPEGPLARAERIGYDKIVAILDHLRAEFGEDRYRVAPRLRRAVRLGRL